MKASRSEGPEELRIGEMFGGPAGAGWLPEGLMAPL